MNAVLIAVAAVLGLALVMVTFLQLLYYESMRLRAHERPSLELFKESIFDRLRLDADRGVLTFSLVKHTALLFLGVVFLLLNPRLWQGEVARPVGEACLSAWLTMLLTTYVAPHVLYRRSSGRWLLLLAPVFRGVAILFSPLVTIFGFFQSLTDLTERSASEEEEPTQADSIEALIAAGAEEGLIEESDRELIQSVVAFGDKRVREVMTPRPNIVAIGAEKSLEDLRQVVINEQYSRIPVYEKSIDHVIGFVHVRDMFELEEEDRKQRTVKDLVRQVRFVPETKPVNDLLREMQIDRAHMAIVVDEYGNTAGLVTLEDLVEEVFGEIRDEHEPGLDISQDTLGHYIVSGNFGLDRLEELVDFHPAEHLESTTVGGLLMEWLGRVPQPGEFVERDGIRVEVLAGNDLRVEQVRVSRTETASHA
jgi:putative hemolysin